jgi:hypothetical protein
MIVAMAMLYALIALPLPYLLVDHYSAVQAGDPDHNEADVHVWLEWAAGSSLSGTGLVLPSVLSPSMLLTMPLVQEFSGLPGSGLRSRGPPATV